MEEQPAHSRRKSVIWIGVALPTLAAIAAIVALWWRRRRRAALGRPAPPSRVPLGQVPPGLTEEEAAARWREGQDNAVHLKPPRTRQQIWRENVNTIFNLSLVGLAFTQLLLQQWWSALLSLITIALNVGIKVGQEMLAMRRLAEFQSSARPRATVVRENKTRSIDPDRIVPGDVLIVGPGDQFLVDGQVAGEGQMVVDESAVTGKRVDQVESLLDNIDPDHPCVIVGGDFNTLTPGAVKDLERRFEAAGLERGSGGAGPTVRFESLGLTLDHIFVRGMTVLAAGTAQEVASSDHLPVWVVLRPQVSVAIHRPGVAGRSVWGAAK